MIPIANKPIGIKEMRKAISDKDVCLAYLQYRKEVDSTIGIGNIGKNIQFPYEILAERFNVPEKVAHRACERACDRDFIEYGVSLRSGWLTEKGMALIKG